MILIKFIFLIQLLTTMPVGGEGVAKAGSQITSAILPSTSTTYKYITGIPRATMDYSSSLINYGTTYVRGTTEYLSGAVSSGATAVMSRAKAVTDGIASGTVSIGSAIGNKIGQARQVASDGLSYAYQATGTALSDGYTAAVATQKRLSEMAAENAKYAYKASGLESAVGMAKTSAAYAATSAADLGSRGIANTHALYTGAVEQGTAAARYAGEVASRNTALAVNAIGTGVGHIATGATNLGNRGLANARALYDAATVENALAGAQYVKSTAVAATNSAIKTTKQVSTAIGGAIGTAATKAKEGAKYALGATGTALGHGYNYAGSTLLAAGAMFRRTPVADSATMTLDERIARNSAQRAKFAAGVIVGGGVSAGGTFLVTDHYMKKVRKSASKGDKGDSASSKIVAPAA